MPRVATLRGRVARTTAAAALAGALIVALVGWVLGRRLGIAHEDRRLNDALRTLALEIDEGARDVAHENREIGDAQRELAMLGIRVAVARQGEPVPGVPWAADRVIGCRTVSALGGARRCVGTHGAFRLEVQASLSMLRESNVAYGIALVLALVPVIAIAAWASRRAARVAILPLERLGHAVERVRPDAPDPALVAEPVACTEVDALRERFATLIGSLAATLGQAQRFASNAAHELRTPLATLRGEIDLLAERPLDSTATAALERIRRTAQSLSWRIDGILLVAGPPTATRPRDPVSLDAAVRDVFASLDKSGSTRVRLETDDEGLIAGDVALLEMLARNAIDNALAYGDGLARVRVVSGAGTVELHVEDDGPGVPRDVRDRVFEAFFRLPGAAVRAPDGMGLGLALVARIATIHAARARFVDSERGAHLVVEFPAWRSSAAG